MTQLVTGLDLETTGLKPEAGHRIIEIAALVYDLDSGRKLGQYVKRINPGRPIDPRAQKVHGIAFSTLADCPEFGELAPVIVKILTRSDWVVAHNGRRFDFPFLEKELSGAGYHLPRVKLLDTMLSGRWATPMGKCPSLEELCFACGIEYDRSQAHAAGYDVEVMMQSFFAARNKGFFL